MLDFLNVYVKDKRMGEISERGIMLIRRERKIYKGVLTFTILECQMMTKFYTKRRILIELIFPGDEEED
jgi:hypothetical protein